MKLSSIVGNLAADAITRVIGDKERTVFTVIEDNATKEGKNPMRYSVVMSGSHLKPYLTKGRKVFVFGDEKIATAEKDGKFYINFSVYASEVILLDWRESDEEVEPSASVQIEPEG